jgi:hypothetical protein
MFNWVIITEASIKDCKKEAKNLRVNMKRSTSVDTLPQDRLYDKKKHCVDVVGKSYQYYRQVLILTSNLFCL